MPGRCYGRSKLMKENTMEETVVKKTNTEETGPAIAGGKFLSFFLGKEEYAIEILKVQEIIWKAPAGRYKGHGKNGAGINAARPVHHKNGNGASKRVEAHELIPFEDDDFGDF